MTRFLLASATAFATMTGVAMAQYPGQATTTQQTTTYTQPAAPTIVTSGATTGTAVRSDGDQTATSGVSSADSSGNRTMTTVTNTSYPLAPYVRTTRTTTNVTNGVATETVTTTDTYPAWAGIAPQVNTTTRNYVVGAR